MKTLLISLFLVLFLFPDCPAQNLSTLPLKQRDSLLFAIARKAALKYGEEPYYTMRISEKIRTEISKEEGHKGEKVYVVVYEYDTVKYAMSTTRMYIYENTAHCYSIMFANDYGYRTERIEREGRTVEKIQYDIRTCEEIERPAREFMEKMEKEWEEWTRQRNIEAERKRPQEEKELERRKLESLRHYEEMMKQKEKAWEEMKERNRQEKQKQEKKK